ncbi:hypothetical protein BH20CHL6_BH20CHL6_09310 [soil metagenome]
MRLTPVRNAILWLLAAGSIALGAGGVVVGGDHPASDRPELTARADAEMAPRMLALAVRLDELQAQVASLGESGRSALIDLTSTDVERLSRILAEGSLLIDGIEVDAAALRREVQALPHGPDSELISTATAERVETLESALGAVEPLREAWERLAAGSVPAIALIGLLEGHDQRVVDAALDGSAGRYAAALDGLDAALADLDTAVEIRDQLARTANVETLDDWIGRLRAYDEALVELYRLLRETDETVTPDVRRAFARVEDAEDALPQDRRALVVIMADIAEGGLNQAVIAVDRARGRLADAAAALR